MGGKLAIATGLVTGLVVGAVALGGVVVLAPAPDPPATSPASIGSLTDPGTGSPSASASPGGPPAASPAAPSVSTSPSASGSPPGSAQAPPAASPSPGGSAATGAFGVGAPAPALSVPRLGGGQVSLAALRGKPVWVNFMATWCPSCQDELPLMNGFAARYADEGLVVVAVDVKQDPAVVDAFVRQLGVVFPVGLDRDGAAQADWRAIALPVHYWVDADGIVRHGALGGIGADVMVAGLESILPGVAVTP